MREFIGDCIGCFVTGFAVTPLMALVFKGATKFAEWRSGRNK